jgi:hypothetical protein
MEGLKYFCPANLADFNHGNSRAEKAALARQRRAERAYRLELEKLKGRISKQALEFFLHGFERTGLHDAVLLRLTVGSGLDFVPDGKRPFYINLNPARVRIEFLNDTQEFHYVFDCRGVRQLICNLPAEGRGILSCFEQLYTYEISRADREYLRLGFLFANEGSMVCEFLKLRFRRTELERQFDEHEKYHARPRKK